MKPLPPVSSAAPRDVTADVTDVAVIVAFVVVVVVVVTAAALVVVVVAAFLPNTSILIGSSACLRKISDFGSACTGRVRQPSMLRKEKEKLSWRQGMLCVCRRKHIKNTNSLWMEEAYGHRGGTP